MEAVVVQHLFRPTTNYRSDRYYLLSKSLAGDILDSTTGPSWCHNAVILIYGTVVVFLNYYCFVIRDGLLFELENGKPKLILLSGGEFNLREKKKTFILFHFKLHTDATSSHCRR